MIGLLSVLRDGVSGFLRWIQQVTQSLPIDERTTLYDKLFAIKEKWMKTIDEYLFPVVTFSDETSAEGADQHPEGAFGRERFDRGSRSGVGIA